MLSLLAAVTPVHARRRVPVADALCVSQSDGPFLALAPAAREAYLAALADAGWKLLRIDFTWSRIQPDPVRFDFAPYDELVGRAAAHGVKLLPILDYGNDWAARAAPRGDDRYPPDDPRTFAAFAAHTARRYRRQVRAWEIWNEPNNGLSGFWKPTPDPAAYARLAVEAARALRHADGSATIVSGGLAPTLDVIAFGTDWGFLSAAAAGERGWLRGFDSAALHPYTFLQAPAPESDSTLPLGPSVVHQIDDFRARLREANAGSLPVWVTEFGWHTAPVSGFPLFPPGVSELDQARFLVRGTVLALSVLVERLCWYTLLDYPHFLTSKEDAFGLFHYQQDPVAGALDPKPSYVAATTLAHVLGPAHFARDLRQELGLPEDAYALSFSTGKPRRRIVVLWALRDELPVRIAIGRAVRRVRRIAMDGGESDLGRPRRVELTLGPTPLYLVLDESR